MTSSFRQRLSRRQLLGTAATATAAAFCGTGTAGGSRPSERITLGLIGAGSRGFNLLDEVLRRDDCQVVAVCDVDEFHYRDREWGKGPPLGRRAAAERISSAYASSRSGTPARGIQQTDDFREVISRTDVDAVLIATPDHWHAICTATAIIAGKDVYCEKPVTHLFAEGRRIADLTARHRTVFQVGSQQRSDSLFRRAAELARNGILGELQRAEVGLPPGYDGPQGSTQIIPVPDYLNHEMWCGPSVRLPLMQARHHRWWRGHRAYGGGVLMDWIGHHNDIAHWAIGCDRSGPEEVMADTWEYPQTEIYNTPHNYTIRCRYANGIESTISSSNQLGLKLIGTAGWVHVTRGRITASDDRWVDPSFRPGSIMLEQSDDHMGNFLDCIRSRSQCIAPAETGHRSITPGHLAFVSAELGKPLQWDPTTETIRNDARGNEILNRLHYESPWAFPEVSSG